MGLAQLLKKIRNLAMHIARYCWDWSARWGKSGTRPDRVVLIKIDAIGDFVLWLGSARTLRHHFRDREIIVIVNHVVAELASKLGFFDHVIGIDLNAYENNWSYRFRTNRKIARLGAGTAIQPTYSRMYVTGDALVRATGANERIGSAGDLHVRTPWQRMIGDRWFTTLVPAADTQLHELERNSEFLLGLGVNTDAIVVHKLPELVALADSLEIREDYFVLFPGAGIPQRMWPVEAFAAVARAVIETYGWRPVICGSSGESELARCLVEQEDLSGAHDLTGRTSLPELVEIIRGARLVIANETSAVHISAATATPSVCLLGGGHFGRFVPYPEAIEAIKPLAVFKQMACFGCDWHCIYQTVPGRAFPCIEAIDINAVISAVNQACDRTKR